ncbi:hypothetical protein [Jejuia pallidilutea]|uniref:DUF4878 domain-containing protein n=1 Tax=Jejuia pallidilutea TaxID=504487 RepID=A0A090VKB9_9FLAO|nr:hypothetical protein [Jejuia pallidilutea]GAL65205.1 hypothetical protein JCM19301_3665 [Jejuia pallidilutea]GAL69253.1 hypothetical protein JCM19302_3982 [Jejuia pallidilutea]GAL89199.1 hypothetical protein JCM19538_2862 [Jejuia pallidilutea]
MKFFTTLVLAFLITCSSFSQSQTEAIEKEAQTYYDYMTNMNLDGVLDYMHPKMFDMAPKAQMKAAMEQMFNSPQMKIEFISNTVNSISDTKEIDSVTYAVVYYNSKMRMIFLTEKDKPKEAQNDYLELMKSTMAAQFGSENVTIDADTTSLVINNNASMFAINDPQYNGWKFLSNEKNMAAFVNSIVPEAVRTALLEKE